ncbi:MAG: hypothetical protein M0Z30_01070 [Actinomycetota bacterium]|nr:hypothetical protein [Actinomycetota bacterium]
MEVLWEQLEARGLIDSSGVVADLGAHVFVGPEGQPLDYSHFRYRVWVPACESVG